MSLNDPRWGNQGNDDKRGDRNRDDNQGPPDLEEVWRDFNQRIAGMFGGKRKGGGNGNGGGGPQLPQLSSKEFGGAVWILIILVVLGWLITGFYTVDANQRAVVFRFGKIQEATGPGWHWRLPYPFESHEKVDKTGLRVVEVGYRNNESHKIPREALMLTDDENIINIQFAVQYVVDLSPDALKAWIDARNAAQNAADGAPSASGQSGEAQDISPADADSHEAVVAVEPPEDSGVPEDSFDASVQDETQDIPPATADSHEGVAAAEQSESTGTPEDSSDAPAQEAAQPGEPADQINRDLAVERYLVTNRNPDETVRQAAESAMREIVGRNKMDFVLYDGRDQIAVDALALMQRILDNYHLGVRIVRVTMQNAQPPEQVQAAFDDAVRAGQDLERQRNEGQAYKNSLDQMTAGRERRIAEDAQAYHNQVIARAEGEAARFEQVYNEYRQAPEVTRQRLYLETMQQVLSASGKVLIDAKSGGNVLLMPLDKLMQQSVQGAPGSQSDTSLNALTMPAAPVAPAAAAAAATSNQSPSLIDPRDRDALRNRGNR